LKLFCQALQASNASQKFWFSMTYWSQRRSNSWKARTFH
jgi:hypothetical protein